MKQFLIPVLVIALFLSSCVDHHELLFKPRSGRERQPILNKLPEELDFLSVQSDSEFDYYVLLPDDSTRYKYSIDFDGWGSFDMVSELVPERKETGLFIEKVVLSVPDTAYIPGLIEDGQAEIVYHLVSGGRKMEAINERTGIKAFSGFYFVHQPRLFPFSLNEFFAPVEIPRDTMTGKSWNRSLSVPENWGKEWQIPDSLYQHSHTLSLEYADKGHTLIATDHGNIACRYVIAKALNQEGEVWNEAHYYFSPKYGIVRMDFIWPGKMTTYFRLDDRNIFN